MSETLCFVHEDQAFCDELSAPYRERGWNVVTTPPSADDALDRLVDAQPLAAIFCLDGDCFESASELAHRLMDDPHCARPLMVFLGGDEESVARARAEIPVGLFVRPNELPWVLKHLTYKG